ncbi:hypothetical protein F5Y02DRAFT_430803 [Annulohypoxylon stygium]|nr:hypothetical protein F5Y02DRAFT_430803 [Annulohypoxylon stygium]
MNSKDSPHEYELSEVDYLLSEIRKHGVQVVPIVRELIFHFSNAAKTAQDKNDDLTHKHVLLQARYSQLETEFNSHYAGTAIDDEYWQTKAYYAAFDQMCKAVDEATEANQKSRHEMLAMLEEHVRMSNENALLRMEVEKLRRENEQMKEEMKEVLGMPS